MAEETVMAVRFQLSGKDTLRALPSHPLFSLWNQGRRVKIPSKCLMEKLAVIGH